MVQRTGPVQVAYVATDGTPKLPDVDMVKAVVGTAAKSALSCINTASIMREVSENADVGVENAFGSFIVIVLSKPAAAV